ncbi:lactonase family protein [Pedobacter sp. MW01-1-1]|uniref:lactonase family protein n=1 Tax=Pedobacter sp. MW01-1-1 TaxID=3383027 RepID=UPI003FEEAABB
MKKINLLLFVLTLSFAAFSQQTNTKLLIGTYTKPGKSEGIYTYNFNSSNGKSALAHVIKGIENPSYLALSPDKKFAYSVNETGNTSTISAFQYNLSTGELTFINKVKSEGADPCYITVDARNVIVANYSGGTITVFKRNENGSLDPSKEIIQHTGKGIDPKGRQESAHVHMVQFTPDHRYLVSTDLGEDKVYMYAYNPMQEGKTLTEKSVFKTNAGTGPRHITFHPNGKYAYLAHEFNGKITTFSYKQGTLKKIQEINTTLPTFQGKIDGADIHVSPDGKFLYESNRGDANSISVFAIAKNGTLNAIETVSTLGKGPRNFCIDPSGKFLLVAHQYTDEVVIFKRNATTGKLSDSGQRIALGSPVCLVFAK